MTIRAIGNAKGNWYVGGKAIHDGDCVSGYYFCQCDRSFIKDTNYGTDIEIYPGSIRWSTEDIIRWLRSTRKIVMSQGEMLSGEKLWEILENIAYQIGVKLIYSSDIDVVIGHAYSTDCEGEEFRSPYREFWTFPLEFDRECYKIPPVPDGKCPMLVCSFDYNFNIAQWGWRFIPI